MIRTWVNKCVNAAYVGPDVGCSILDMKYPPGSGGNGDGCVDCGGNGGDTGGPGKPARTPPVPSMWLFAGGPGGGGSSSPPHNPDVDNDNGEGPGGGGGNGGSAGGSNEGGQGLPDSTTCWHRALGNYAAQSCFIGEALTDIELEDLGSTILTCLLSPGSFYACLVQEGASYAIRLAIWHLVVGVTFISSGRNKLCEYWAECWAHPRGRESADLQRCCRDVLQADLESIPEQLSECTNPDINNLRSPNIIEN